MQKKKKTEDPTQIYMLPKAQHSFSSSLQIYNSAYSRIIP